MNYEDINNAPAEAPELEPAPKPKAKNPYKTAYRKRRKKFRKNFRRFLIIALALFAVIWGVLWFFLGRYQQKVDAEEAVRAEEQAAKDAELAQKNAEKRAPQLAFSEWFESLSGDKLAELWFEAHPGSSDSRETVSGYLNGLLGAEDVKCFKGLDSSEAAPVFVVKSGDEVLLRVKMVGSGTEWSVGETELAVGGDNSGSVRAASGIKVFCNGIELTDKYIDGEGELLSYAPLKDKLVAPVRTLSYNVSDMLLAPEFSFEPPEGMSICETESGDHLLCLEGSTAENCKAKAVSFVKAYLYYILKGGNGTTGNLWQALAYVASDSQAFKDLQDSYIGVVWNSDHQNVNTDDMTAGDLIVWADNCCSVDISYNASGFVNGVEDKYSAVMRVYFINNGYGYEIHGFENA